MQYKYEVKTSTSKVDTSAFNVSMILVVRFGYAGYKSKNLAERRHKRKFFAECKVLRCKES